MKTLRSLALSLLLLSAVPLQASDLSALVEPGWLHYSLEPRFELQRSTGARGLSLLTERYTLPLMFQYGLVEGTEGVIELPLVRYGASSIDQDDPSVTGRGKSLTGFGLGDLAMGFKYRLLDDNGATPAIFLLPLLKLPTGSSSLESYARTQGGEDVPRGTGTGSMDVETSLIVSTYADPVENYVRLTYGMRGADDRLVHGHLEHVDYGSRMELLGGLASDFGENWSLAMESLAVVNQASRWTEDGIDVQALKSAQLQNFRAATLAQSNINLSSTMEWYVGPKIAYRFARGFAAALRVEVGLTPDALPLRAGLELSGAVRPGNFLARVKRLKARGKDPVTLEVSEADAEEKAAEGDQAEQQERGNLQRYLTRRLRLAEKAASEKAWDRAAEELGRLVEMATLAPGFKERLAGLQAQLFAVSEKQFQSALEEIKREDWAAAAKSLRDQPRYLRSLDAGSAEVRDLKQRQQAKSHVFRLQGLDLYTKDKTREALDRWTVAALLDPADASLPRDIERARAKLKAIQKLSQP